MSKPALGAKRPSSFAAYLRPRTLVMLTLGFSSGLPFLLVGNTFGYWLRDEGTSLTAIGFISWVGIAYSLKFLWAPVIDRVSAPFFGRLGRRRSWMALAQIMVALALIAMAATGPKLSLVLLGVFGGAEVAGVAGSFLSVPSLAMARILYVRTRRSRLSAPLDAPPDAPLLTRPY